MALINPSPLAVQRPRLSRLCPRGFANGNPCKTSTVTSNRRLIQPSASLRRSKRQAGGTGILNLFPITYAFRPRLRDRLTLGGRTFPRKSQDFGGPNFHRTFRYSCPHHHFHTVHVRLPSRFTPYGTLFYHPENTLRRSRIRGFGSGFSPDHFRRKITRLVSCYALFK